ncbi:hypothetical protein ACB092_01G377600 [Castanea dentata]
MAFLRGDEVEGCSKQVGFVGSYYAATVINNYGNKSYAVQYKNLVTEDKSHPLIEIVSADEVRPLPPKVSATWFASFDVVDAFDNDGWWVGKVSGRQGFDYFVFFDTYGVEIPYPTSRLRPHFEWVNGKWVSKKRV